MEDDDRLAARLSRMALGPARAAARSGRSALAGEAERAIDGALAGPLPEHVARSLVEHRVLERVLAEWLDAVASEQPAPSPERERLRRAAEQALASPAVEQRLADAVGSRLTETLAERVAQSAAFRRALAEVLESPELRRAITRQTAGFGAEVGASFRGRTRTLDDRVDRRVRRAIGREDTPPSTFGGLATRGIALVVDAALAQVAFLVAAGSFALIASLAGSLHGGWAADSAAGGGWTIVVAAYFVVFWSATGQTPGMRLMRLRVLTGSGTSPSALRSVVRFFGLLLAIVTLGAGFLPVLFDRRRRALQDYLAGTVVITEGN